MIQYSRSWTTLSLAASVLVVIGLLPAAPAASATKSPESSPVTAARDSSTDEDGIPLDERTGLLGRDWRSNGDQVHAVVADADAINVVSANSRDGYRWETTSSLDLPETDTDRWISNSCTTSSGEYMAVVFAPRAVTNSDVGMSAGAAAAIVDLSTGEWTLIEGNYTIAYFNPGCGAADTVTLTSYDVDSGASMVAVIDAESKRIISKVKVDGQATSAISNAAGVIYASTPEGVVAVSPKGKVSPVTKTEGTAFSLAVDETGRLGYLVADDEEATAYVSSPETIRKPRLVGRGQLAETGLRSSAAGFYVTGQGAKLAGSPRDVSLLPEAQPGAVISSEGALVVNSIKPAGLARAADESTELADAIEIAAIATATAKDLDFRLAPDAPTLAPESTTSYEALRAETTETTPSGAAATSSRLATVTTAGDPNEPAETERSCAVPRNDPKNQAYQPKPRQVEWAVNRAVMGQLTETRPANWRNLGMASYSPQGLFPRPALSGGGSIPAQISLAVLMQESNLWQASRYTAPGNTGNPLIGDYYGNRGTPWEVHFADADCGYGVGQITDGMRLAGKERPGETALPANQQRAIALDYTANIAMSVRMLSQKWNELAAMGITINNGDSRYIENWFGAVWAYNTGVQPSVGYGNPGCTPSPTCTGPSGTWGLGWSNNPINPIYNPARQPFLQFTAADAANPQQWPYPEKIMGFAAWGLELPQTQWANPSTRTYDADYAHSFRVAEWLGTDNAFGVINRTQVKPPRELFCDVSRNLCDPSATAACTLGNKQCWWNGNATWKPNCSDFCGYGFQRFNATYATEASSMASSLPALTLQSSFLPNCAAVPAGWLVIDDTKQASARNSSDCTTRASTGSFAFTFPNADANGSYPAKIDLHQQGGGFNGHFYFARMHAANADINSGDRLKVTGKWNLGQTLNQWTRVWVHMPSYAAWTPQAGYTVSYAPNKSQTRFLPQRRYQNEWVPLGVFNVNGVPTVSLTNLVSDVNPADPRGAGIDDVAWDAVAFEPLSAKPDHFVVSMGDSYSSGEGAGDYLPWSDNNGSSSEKRNRCHQSNNAWIRKSVIPGETQTIGAMANSKSPDMDFHFLACSGAESEHLLPYHSVTGTKPINGAGESGRYGQNGMVSQMDAGYLDSNTTLVTLSIGGNDMRFAPVISACFGTALSDEVGRICSNRVLAGDHVNVLDASNERLESELPQSLATVLSEIRLRAPNADIVLMGYPKLFETGSQCVGTHPWNQSWLNQMSDAMQDVMDDAVAPFDSSGARAIAVNPQPAFSGKNLCTSGSGLNALVVPLTPGEPASLTIWDFRIVSPDGVLSQESVHPNGTGTDLYSSALEDAFASIYP